MREYASSTGNEYAEQSKFELGEMNFILALEHNAACLVNSYVTECKYGIAATIASRAPQVCAHPGEQFHHAEGFGDVVISAKVKRFDFGVVARARRENDDRYATVGAEGTNEISAVSVW